MNKGIVIIGEVSQGTTTDLTLELISQAHDLNTGLGQKISCIFITDFIQDQQVAALNVDQVIVYKDADFFVFRQDLFLPILEEEVKHLKPAIVLAGGTIMGKTLAAGLAVKCHTGVTADCTQLELNAEGKLEQVRPAFGGNVMAKIISKSTFPQIATARAGVFSTKRSKVRLKPAISYPDYGKQESKIEIVETIALQEGKTLSDAKVIVVAGNGFKSKEDLSLAAALADSMGAHLAATRALTEKGWFDKADQIGLSGMTVKPDLLISLGVSGSIQFMSGMKESKYIIAVNSLADAPIFSLAHLPIQGDLYKIIPILIEKLTSRGGS